MVLYQMNVLPQISVNIYISLICFLLIISAFLSPLSNLWNPQRLMLQSLSPNITLFFLTSHTKQGEKRKKKKKSGKYEGPVGTGSPTLPISLSKMA